MEVWVFGRIEEIGLEPSHTLFTHTPTHFRNALNRTASISLLLALFILLDIRVVAQPAIEQYSFKELFQSEHEKAGFQSLLDALQVAEDSFDSIQHGVAEVEDKLVIATIIQHQEHGDDASKSQLIIQQRDERRHKKWRQALDVQAGSPERIVLSNSTVFYDKDVLYVKLFRKIYWDLQDDGFADFYAFRGDAGKYLGSIFLYSLDNPADPPEGHTFDGHLMPFTSMEEGVGVTLMRKDLSKYKMEYLLTPDTLKLVTDHRPEFHITREEAEEKFEAIINAYYSEEMKLMAYTHDGELNRAETFLWQFYELRALRSDYAPAHYNIACMAALLNRSEEALSALKKALELDGAYKKKAATDPDLASLRTLPAFLELFD